MHALLWSAFLLQINMIAEDVVSILNTCPDYDAERTRYQVEHIAGASGTCYKPPACATMTTYGNCQEKTAMPQDKASSQLL